MKRFLAAVFAVFIAATPVTASPADADRTLQNLKGSVTYGADPTPKSALAVRATTALADKDYAATGADSSATITLPDSSVVQMASNSSVQMESFARTDMAHARFVVVGKIRFNVAHPQGAKADYTFQTSTGQIAVRGTVGDIAAGPQGGLQVNVYALTDPSLPVQVTLVNGQVFALAAGQALVVTAAAGAVVAAAVTAVSQSAFAPFAELGAPANASSLGISATTTTTATTAGTTTATTTATTAGTTASTAGAAAGAATATTTAVAAGAVAAGAAAATISNSNKSSATPTPAPTATPTPRPTPTPTPTPTASPTPTPSPTSTLTPVPITVSGKGARKPGSTTAGVSPPPVPPAQIRPHSPGGLPPFPGARPTPPI